MGWQGERLVVKQGMAKEVNLLIYCIDPAKKDDFIQFCKSSVNSWLKDDQKGNVNEATGWILNDSYLIFAGYPNCPPWGGPQGIQGLDKYLLPVSLEDIPSLGYTDQGKNPAPSDAVVVQDF